MGMFDKIIAKSTCPYCDYEGKFNFQTKEFESMMDEFKIGDLINRSPGKRLYWAVAYTTCDKCEKWFYVDLITKDGRLLEVKNPITEDEYEKLRDKMEPWRYIKNISEYNSIIIQKDGSIKLPKELCEKLQLNGDDELKVFIEGSKIVLEKIKRFEKTNV